MGKLKSTWIGKAGFSSGVSLNYVTMTIPILIPLGLIANPWYPAVAFAPGYIGVMLSPLHLCAVMSADYFKQPVGKILLKTVLAESPVLGAAFAIVVLVHYHLTGKISKVNNRRKIIL